VSLLAAETTHGIAEPLADVPQPEGKFGGVAASKFWFAPHVAGPAQTSPVVHGLLSSQAFVLLACTHWPVAGLHVSSVHTLLSLQLTAVPEHEPPEQTSPVVQAFPSLQVAVFGV
jgi:hypothetical protein